MLAWYVAKVKPRSEQQVQNYLNRFGVKTYAPEILVVQRGRRRMEPLFPSYLFVKTDPASGEWPLVHWARGLSDFLGHQPRPTPCPEGLATSVQQRVEQWNAGGWQEALQPGDRLTIRSGPFKELDAVFQCYGSGGQRCRVLVGLMGRVTPVTLPMTEIAGVPFRGRFALPP